MIVDSFVSRDN